MLFIKNILTDWISYNRWIVPFILKVI